MSRAKLVRRLEKLGWQLEPIPWCAHGYWVLRPRWGLGNTAEHSLGYIYLQEAASMVPPLVLRPREREIVLDLCAAPGSKTTQMAQLMNNTGLVVANDVDRKRIRALAANLQRCGVVNTLVTRMDGRIFSQRVSQRFDRVLVDAPCSGSGTVRNNPHVAQELSLAGISRLSQLQKALLISGFDCLARGGVLVYSTCSLEPEENEEVIDYLLAHRERTRIERVRVSRLRVRAGLVEWEGTNYTPEVRRCVRIYPQDNDTEGFFIARVRKV
jgi:NOL1/NOP2/sun family putative RNA methylase